MQDSQEVIFTGGMDSDSDLRFVADGDYRYLTNGRIGAGANTTINPSIGGIQTVTGNTLQNNPDVISDGTIIQSTVWVEENAILYSVFSQSGRHQIWLYYIATQTFTLVLEHINLNFKKPYRIYHSNIVNGLYYWTDGFFDSFLNGGASIPQYNPPRMFNIEKMINYSMGTGNGGYTVVDFQTLDALKWPHTSPPTAVYTTNSAIENNNLYGFRFKFRVRFVYDNYELSAWSPMSKVPIPTLSDFMSGRNWFNTTQDNEITVTVDTGHEIVIKIQVAVSVNDGEYGIFVELDKSDNLIPDNSTWDITYRNDHIIYPIPQNTRNYDRLPQIAFAQEYLPNNELVYSNFYEGYDSVDLNVSVERILTEIEGVKGGFPTIVYDNTGTGVFSCTGGTTYFKLYEVYNSLTEHNYWVEGDVIQCDGTNDSVYYTVTAADILAISAMSIVNANDYMMQVIGAAFASQLGAAGVWNGGSRQYNISNNFVCHINEYWFSKTLRLTNPYPTLQTPSRQEFAIQYYDRGNRDGTVQTNDGLILEIPTPPAEDTSAFTDPNSPYSVAAQITITSLPPEWPTHYQLLARERNPQFQWRSCTRIEDTGFGRLKISLEREYLDTYGVLTDDGQPGGAQIYHRPQKGDVLRPIRKQAENFTDIPSYVSDGNVIELEVLQYSTNEGYNNSECVWVDMFEWQATLGGSSGFVVQIETPEKASDVKVWREIGAEFAILNPHTATRYHAGNTQNQTAILPAKVLLDYYDCWMRPRYMGTGYGVNEGTFIWEIQDPLYSDYYLPYINDYGRLGYEVVGNDLNTDQKSVLGNRTYRKSDGIHSNAYVEDSSTNGLSAFDFNLTNTFHLDSQWGGINRLIMSGYTLKAIQERKETSIYIQRVPYVSDNGNREFTNKTFGGINPYDTLYGTIDPGSVCVVDNGIIYYDFYSDKVIHSRNNGQVDLSDTWEFKFSSQINDFKEIIISYGREDTYVFAFFDMGNHEYVMSAIYLGDFDSQLPNNTSNFCYNTNIQRWVQVIARPYEWGQSHGGVLVTFYQDSQLYLENIGNEQEFYGEDVYTEIFCVINKYPTVTKRALSVGVKSKYAPDHVTLLSPYNTMYANGQETAMPVFQRDEEWFWARVLRDYLSPNFASTTLAQYNGREMRSSVWQYAIILPHSDNKNYVYSAKLMFTISESGQ